MIDRTRDIKLLNRFEEAAKFLNKFIDSVTAKTIIHFEAINFSMNKPKGFELFQVLRNGSAAQGEVF